MSAADRRAELAERLAQVRARRDAACVAAGRDPGAVALLAVTKFHPAADVALLAELGCTDFGESRDQEGSRKRAEIGADVRWHMIGQIQRNKARSIARWAGVVHSVDDPRLVAALDRARDQALQESAVAGPLAVYVQVSLDGDARRGGVPDAEVDALADVVAGCAALRLAGVMAIPPLDVAVERAYAGLAGIAARVRANHPAATGLSAGMSGDLETAIAYGSTCVRVGTALLGTRPIH